MNYYQKNRILLIGFFVVVLLLISIAGLAVPQSGKNFQKVFSNIPNDNILGLSKLIYNENEKKQDLFLSKLEQLNHKMMAEQAKRLDRLEQINADLLRQVKVLKNSSPGLSLRDKLIYLHPYESSVRFPAYIWQAWKHGLNDDRFGELYREGERQWAAKNPGFAHEIFNDDTAFAVIKHLYISAPEVVEAYELLPEVILKMDFFRYLILYAKGGAYADIDTFPLQPIPNWIPENVTPDELGMIIGIESDSNSRNWREELVRRLQFGQFVIQAKPGHPILREMIARITQNTLKLKARPEDIPDDLKLTGTTNEKSLKILKWTGSGLWTDVIFDYFNNYIQSSIYQKISWKDFRDVKIPKLVSDVLVLPKSSFASDLEVPKDGKIEDNLAFAKHYASKLWKNN
ncbi:Piso0_005407 [Millerozyma farinosa CBS 7064]|uniref:Piso0_005407 protein n=1 Tax=Pichia sorbitophila (strain ATCC MYA-4447 / BCRC 22081 / CBS 7064 / NBRC 10061 / NRRL Y-12695) TaxID=559304 RepID=G8Y509_PICSO|nr:Piso0_005407 [Millerozyma farinosa CBS 7064]